MYRVALLLTRYRFPLLLRSSCSFVTFVVPRALVSSFLLPSFPVRWFVVAVVRLVRFFIYPTVTRFVGCGWLLPVRSLCRFGSCITRYVGYRLFFPLPVVGWFVRWFTVLPYYLTFALCPRGCYVDSHAHGLPFTVPCYYVTGLRLFLPFRLLVTFVDLLFPTFTLLLLPYHVCYCARVLYLVTHYQLPLPLPLR